MRRTLFCVCLDAILVATHLARHRSLLGKLRFAGLFGLDLFLALLLGVVVILWYYVWFGSIVFALRGSFPGLSIRSFSFVLGFVYTYWFAAPWLYGRDIQPLPMPLTMAVGAMQLIALCGMTFLPSLQLIRSSPTVRAKKCMGKKMTKIGTIRGRTAELQDRRTISNYLMCKAIGERARWSAAKGFFPFFRPKI